MKQNNKALPKKRFTKKQLILTAIVLLILTSGVLIYIFQKNDDTVSIPEAEEINSNSGLQNTAEQIDEQSKSFKEDIESDETELTEAIE